MAVCSVLPLVVRHGISTIPQWRINFIHMHSPQNKNQKFTLFNNFWRCKQNIKKTSQYKTNCVKEKYYWCVQGKLTGLCGNFDSKTVNEMRTPENLDSTTPQEFGNSWTAVEVREMSPVSAVNWGLEDNIQECCLEATPFLIIYQFYLNLRMMKFYSSHMATDSPAWWKEMCFFNYILFITFLLSWSLAFQPSLLTL